MDDIGDIFFFFFPFSEKDIGQNSIEEIEKRKKFEISSEKYDMEGESVFEEYTWEWYQGGWRNSRVVIKIDLIQNTKPGTICKFDSTRWLHE